MKKKMWVLEYTKCAGGRATHHVKLYWHKWKAIPRFLLAKGCRSNTGVSLKEESVNRPRPVYCLVYSYVTPRSVTPFKETYRSALLAWVAYKVKSHQNGCLGVELHRNWI